jgi:hypothetical protein
MTVGVSECLKHWQLTSVMEEEFAIRLPGTEEIATIEARLLRTSHITDQRLFGDPAICI